MGQNTLERGENNERFTDNTVRAQAQAEVAVGCVGRDRRDRFGGRQCLWHRRLRTIRGETDRTLPSGSTCPGSGRAQLRKRAESRRSSCHG